MSVATVRAGVLLAVAATALAQTTPSKPALPPRKPAVSTALPNYNELKYPELRPIAAPAVQSVTLPNGMRLLLLENHELPLVNGTVLVRAGSAFDPQDKFGLAAITTQVMLEGGTTARPGVELVRRFQNLGAELDGIARDNMLAISFQGLKANIADVLDALKEGLTSPEFPQERIDLVKVRLRNSIARRNDDGAAILRREFAAAIFGRNSPYGAQLEYANLDRINRGDLVAFHKRYFFPRNLTLALEGDFDSARIKGQIEGLFEDWTSQQPAVPELPAVENAVAPEKLLAVKRDAQNSYFEVGQVGGDSLDKDYPALEVMSGILGAGPRGRLSQLLRGQVDGLTVDWSPGFGRPGLFQVAGTIANPFLTTKVLQAVYGELNKIRVEEVSEQELKTAKASALNSLVFSFDNQFSILPRLAEYQYFNFPADYTQQYQKALEGVTRADVLRVARERLDPAKMTTMVVANPTAFESPLESLGGSRVRVIDLAIPPSKVEATLGDAASQRRAKQLLGLAQQAMGGVEKLAALTDYTRELGYQFDVSAGGTQATMTERWIAPGYLRQDTTVATGNVSVYCDGKAGWIASGTRSAALTGMQLKQVQGDLFYNLVPLLLSDRTPARRITSLDDQTVEISDGAGQIAKLVFDSATGLPKNLLYEATTVNGTAPVIETYADYRGVSGLKFPYKVTIVLAGKKFQEITVKSMQIDSGLKMQDLEKRP
jgi:predicted Zn-dependent peptidase